ncbi:unnamed protein product [Tenebrio molitor]|nr:unnamed protein product [Tenebrio molitor]
MQIIPVIEQCPLPCKLARKDRQIKTRRLKNLVNNSHPHHWNLTLTF